MKTAVLGASGLVGRTMLALLENCPWVIEDPVLLVSARSAGQKLPFREREIVCQEVKAELFNGIDVALFSAGGQTSLKWAPVAVLAGAWVVDNSSAFRMQTDVSLVVPEINNELVPDLSQTATNQLDRRTGGIIANPNCSTIQVAMALAPLEKTFGLTEVHVTTMQSVSGGGKAAVAELEHQNTVAVNQQGLTVAPNDPNIFPRQITGNVIPAIGEALDCGGFEEEVKVERELRKILDRPVGLAVTCTATRVPVVGGHSAAIRVVCSKPVTPEQAVEVLSDFPGLVVTADPHDYLTPIEISGSNNTAVGRIRQDPDNDQALLLWVVADNLLKGAAWNAVQIGYLLAGSK